jgi:hypothetical protein
MISQAIGPGNTLNFKVPDTDLAKSDLPTIRCKAGVTPKQPSPCQPTRGQSRRKIEIISTASPADSKVLEIHLTTPPESFGYL